MKLNKLGNTFPEDGRLILAVYENDNSELEFEVLEYDGRLSYKSESTIFWSYIHNQPERSKREDLHEYEWEKVDGTTPERVYLQVKTSRGDIGMARLYVSYYANSDDHYEWMCPKGYDVPGRVSFWNSKYVPSFDCNDYSATQSFEDSYKCEMRCSEHCGDTVSPK